MTRYMILIRTDGTGRLIRCDDGDTCKLETLQQLVGGLIETADSCLEPGWAREPVDSIKLIGFAKPVCETICEEFGIDMEDGIWND